jgi:hypothetical protein
MLDCVLAVFLLVAGSGDAMDLGNGTDPGCVTLVA